WPVDLAIAIGPQPHLGPFLGEHEELFGVDPRQPRGRKVTDQVTQGTRRRPAGIDPSSERHHHRRQVGRRLAVELDVVHHHPLGWSTLTHRPVTPDRSIASISVWRWTARLKSTSNDPPPRSAPAARA